MESAERRIVRIRVEGRVQGVGFRAFVTRAAARLRLIGWVRNRFDGAVEIVAAGPSEAIEELEREAKRGPAAARVDACRLEEADEQDLQEAGGIAGFFEAPTL
ncbi:MAG: acylphosphatase [Methylocystaceae bacterium]|nr:MAG: acylphosphatase [Methylocystaceae bacterium]